MKKRNSQLNPRMRWLTFSLLLFGSIVGLSFSVSWGFYGHRLINKMAVFTLPPEMLGLYKRHIYYISEHAVDPDKRRYALKNEAYRHYIDIDHWDTIPFPNVPRDIKTAILTHGTLVGITTEKDSADLSSQVVNIDSLYYDLLSMDRYSKVIELDSENVSVYLSHDPVYEEYLFLNPFVGYGVLPYFLEDYYHSLVRQFSGGNLQGILRVSADIGHYISDAHVPLHTTVNYNGQLTNQLGIHAFWESRLPELFAEDRYDMVVGKAEYIEDKRTYFWDIITDSHRLLAEVLEDEVYIKKNFPTDRQFCFDERLERTVRIQCKEYAAAYHNLLDGMVEKRMQDAILAIGNLWYSAWIDAGQPDLDKLEQSLDKTKISAEQEALDKARNQNKIFGREH